MRSDKIDKILNNEDEINIKKFAEAILEKERRAAIKKPIASHIRQLEGLQKKKLKDKEEMELKQQLAKVWPRKKTK